MKKQKLSLEYPLKATSVNLVWEQIRTVHGLERWLADRVEMSPEGILSLTWGEMWAEHHTLRARVENRDRLNRIRLRWVDEDDSEAYWEMRIGRSELTGELCLYVTDFAPAGELDDLTELWDGNMERLHNVSGF